MGVGGGWLQGRLWGEREEGVGEIIGRHNAFSKITNCTVFLARL